MSNKVEFAAVLDIPTHEFMRMDAAPGHRDSKSRAHKADHLRILVPEHLEVDVAEYNDDAGHVRRVRMTGNTRAHVWKCGLSDAVPENVRARVFRMKDADEVKQRMLRQDSQEAGWKAQDYVFRALNMAYPDGWRPQSKALSGGRFVLCIRTADALVNHFRWSPDQSTKVELIMVNWTKELKLLDDLCDHPLADTIRERKPFTAGFLAGFLVLFHFMPDGIVADYGRAIFNNRGYKEENKCDGVQAVIQNLGKGGSDYQKQLLRYVIGGFYSWQKHEQSESMIDDIQKFDPLDWMRVIRDQSTSMNIKHSAA